MSLGTNGFTNTWRIFYLSAKLKQNVTVCLYHSISNNQTQLWVRYHIITEKCYVFASMGQGLAYLFRNATFGCNLTVVSLWPSFQGEKTDPLKIHIVNEGNKRVYNDISRRMWAFMNRANRWILTIEIPLRIHNSQESLRAETICHNIIACFHS
jgi:hypothetical protein